MSNFAFRRESEIVERCVKIAHEASSKDGFVPMHRLVGLLNAAVVFRPLFVEAVVAKKKDLSISGPNWKILLNVKTFAEDAQNYFSESSKNHLSVRVRNTIAHELIHTLQYRIKDDEIVLNEVSRSVTRSDAIIRRVEREAHELTSLLLLPREHLEQSLRSITEFEDINTYVQIFQKFGVSREIYIQALRNLNKYHDSRILYHDSLKDVMFGIGTWDKDAKPCFKQWPTFINFSGNSLPEFTIAESSANKDYFQILQLPKESILLGGNLRTVYFTAFEGSKVVPRYKKIEYALSVEERKTTHGLPFLFLLKRVREI